MFIKIMGVCNWLPIEDDKDKEVWLNYNKIAYMQKDPEPYQVHFSGDYHSIKRDYAIVTNKGAIHTNAKWVDYILHLAGSCTEEDLNEEI